MYMYVKFYKRPSCTTSVKNKCFEIKSVLTVTNDLGEKFFFGELDLQVELVLIQPPSKKTPVTKETVVDTQVLKWTTGARALTYTAKLPLGIPSTTTFYVRANVPRPTEVVDMLLDSYEYTEGDTSHTFLPIQSVPCRFSDPGRDKNTTDCDHLALRNLDTQCPGYDINIIEETKGSIASHIWDAALAVSKELCSDESVLKKYIDTPRSIIELGAGCGFTGLVMAAMYPQAQVVLTDFEEAREACQRNIDLNIGNLPKTGARSHIQIAGGDGKSSGRVLFQPLEWEEEDLSKIPRPVYHKNPEQVWDVVLVTDCIYNRASFDPLLCILQKLVTTGTTLLLAHKYRAGDSGELFYEMLAEKFTFVHDMYLRRYDEKLRILVVRKED